MVEEEEEEEEERNHSHRNKKSPSRWDVVIFMKNKSHLLDLLPILC